MLATHKDLQRLLDFQAPNPHVVSAYLAFDGGSPAAALKALRRRCPGAEAPKFRADLHRLERLVEDPALAGARGAAAFSCNALGLWRAYALPVPPRPGLFLEAKPYLPPLLSLTDQHQRYGVALVGGPRPRVLEAFLGQVADRADLKADDPSGIAAALEALTRRQGFQRLILVCPSDMEAAIVERLHSLLEENLILDRSLDSSMDDSEIARRLLAREGEARQVREQVLAHRLLDRAAEGAAVTGLPKTLDAFRDGRVRRVVARAGFTKLGRSCPGCGRLSFEEPRCVLCGRATEIIFDLVGEIVDRTMRAGGEAVILFDNTPLDNVGRIGAELAATTREPAPAGGL